MKSAIGRTYVVVAATVVFFLLWAVVAAHPWAPTPPVDPRVVALNAREQAVRLEVAHARAAVARKWTAYSTNLQRRKKAIQRANALRAVAVARANTIALSRRRVVYGSVGSRGGYSYGGGRASGGGGGGGGGSSSGGGSAPPIVSVGSGAPVSSSGTS